MLARIAGLLSVIQVRHCCDARIVEGLQYNSIENKLPQSAAGQTVWLLITEEDTGASTGCVSVGGIGLSLAGGSDCCEAEEKDLD